MAWKIQISPEARIDIQDAINWYNSRQKGLGNRFFKEVKNSLNQLKKNPYYSIKYQQVRCLKVYKFPYLIHFILDESTETIIIPGILNTSLNPDENWYMDLE